jgi:hypothetical protein
MEIRDDAVLEIEAAHRNSDDSPLLELNEIQLALVGGGTGDVIFG